MHPLVSCLVILPEACNNRPEILCCLCFLIWLQSLCEILASVKSVEVLLSTKTGQGFTPHVSKILPVFSSFSTSILYYYC